MSNLKEDRNDQLQKENQNKVGKISCVSDYIKKISEIISEFNDENENEYKSEKKVFVYRGHSKIYEKYDPNLFRENFKNNILFEKNVLDNIISNGFDKQDNSYFLTAIEAQHGGLQTRLLDISFNSLIALHFAVTPNPCKEIDLNDGEDGEVLIFEVDEFYSPAAEDLHQFYEEILLNRDNNQSTKEFAHFFVDFYKKNNRISAQQGCFILFSGKKFSFLPDHKVKSVIIPGESKKIIRKELVEMFGIDNGYVYPELQTLTKNIEYSSKHTRSITNYKENFTDNFLSIRKRNIKFLVKKIDEMLDDEGELLKVELSVTNSFIEQHILDEHKKLQNKGKTTTKETLLLNRLIKRIIEICLEIKQYGDLLNNEESKNIDKKDKIQYFQKYFIFRLMNKKNKKILEEISDRYHKLIGETNE